MSQLKTQKLNVLTLPLKGIQLIEASAGTGKTWTLAALYVRLILGHAWSGPSLMPPQILVTSQTFAKAIEYFSAKLRVSRPNPSWHPVA